MKTELSEFITMFSWGFATSLQIVFSLMALLIYLKSRDSVFGWYALYCSLMLVYCLTKTPDFLYHSRQVGLWKSHIAYQSFYWTVQVLYHNAYLAFGVRFVSLQDLRPGLYRLVGRYQLGMLTVTSGLCLATSSGLVKPAALINFFLTVFTPLHILVCVTVLFMVVWHRRKLGIFVIGTSCYMFLILVSFALSHYQLSIGPIKAAAVFYLAIIVESALFSFGLGLRIKDIYQERLQFQYNLNSAHTKLQAELQKQIEAQKREKLLLLEVKEKQELDITVARLNDQVFRSQMNSHFIFNVLNSIKLFIMENETKMAVQYLAKFSRFIRKILDGSVYEHNTLKSELETISLYLNIEKIRLSDAFDFSIHTATDIDSDQHRLPALLLQPFVENALWHGVMKSPGEKRIEITVVRQGSGILIGIADTGPGIDYHERNQPEHPQTQQSHGLQIVNSRIQYHNQRETTKISYTITDRSTFSSSRGTLVEVLI